jgi:hypothetical protein
MKFLIAVVMLMPLGAQDAKPPDQKPAEEQKPADAKAADTTPPESPVPSTEARFSGWIDLGYRWLTGVGGSLDTYRSIVNLGSGPKLVGAEFTLTDPASRVYDKIHVRAYSWGDEPYESFHLDAAKSKWYNFNADYRDFAYFNFLPSYADPLLSKGIMLNEQSFDTRRKIASFALDLRPGSRIIPYFGYDRDSGSGMGATAFVTDANQFPVPNTMYDLTNLYRGGVRFEFRRAHVTLEEGGTTYRNDQNLFQNPQGSRNTGNFMTPVFGQTIYLTNLLAAYGIRGSSIYSKGLFTASAASWLDLYGQFLWSQPKDDVNYQQTNAGNFLLQSQLLFYTSQSYLLSAMAKMPHTTGNFGAEMRPAKRMRLIESWTTDRLHNAGSASSNQVFTNASTSQTIASLLESSLVTNYNQAEIDLLYDATSKIMLRGGYRYVWGDAMDAVTPPAGLASSDRDKLRRNVGLGAVTFRPGQKVSVTTEAEIGRSGGTYFRTSLYDYEKVRAQARYQALKTLSLSADFTALINHNPIPGVNYDYQSLMESVAFSWSPGKIGDIQGAYTRSTIYSNINYLAPQDLSTQVSKYRDNAHTATALWNIKLADGAKLAAGGSFVISSGSRPTSYYQPLATLWVPFGKHVSWFAEWRYYGYGEPFYLYEGFRAHLVTTGVRLTR